MADLHLLYRERDNNDNNANEEDLGQAQTTQTGETFVRHVLCQRKETFNKADPGDPKNSDLHIGVRQLRVRVLRSENAHLRNLTSGPNTRAQYEKLVLVVEVVRQSEGR